MKTIYLISAILGLALLAGCDTEPDAADGGSVEMTDTELVPSGTYVVTAAAVDPEEEEIYAETEDGRTIELYLRDSTILTRYGEPAEFSALQQGQRLRVEVERNEDSLEPISVDILAANN